MKQSELPHWPIGGGEMGKLVRVYDWSATSLGPCAAWPQTLKTTIDILLRSPAPMALLWGADGITIYNDAYAMFAGAMHPKLLGSSVMDAWPESAGFAACMLKTCLGGESLSYHDQEFTIYRNGKAEQVWLNLDCSPVLDDSGRPAGVLLVLLETTEKVAAERTLRYSEEHFRLALKNSPMVVFTQDKDLRYTWAFNPQLGYSVQDVLGKTDDGLHSLEVASPLNQIKRGVLKTGSGAREEVRVSRDGRDYFYDLTVEPLRDPDGEIIGIACAALDITERKKADLALHAAEERLRFLLSTTPAVIYTCEASDDYRVTFISDNVATQLGYEPHEWQEDPCFWANHIHPEDAPVFFAKRAGLSEGDNAAYEYRFLHKDGTCRWLLDDAGLIRDEKGFPGEIAGYLIDVTARKAAEKELARRTRQLTDAQRLAHIGSWDWDLETDTVIWSEEHYHMFGVDPENYRPTYETNMQFIHAEDRKKGREAVDAAIAALGSFDVELRLVRTDGVERYVVSRGEVTVNSAGRPVRMVGTIQDITERKLAEEALRQSEAKFRALAEASPALIALLDAAGKAVYLNPQHVEFFGVTAAELMDTGWHSIVHPDDAGAYVAAVEQALRGRTRFHQRVRVKSKQGDWRWLEGYASPWFTGDGRYAGHVCLSIDVTETVQAEEALREADRRKDEFLATLAHELRNPLAPICNVMPLIGRPGGNRVADKLQGMLERQVKHIVRLVDDLMDVSRITRGKIELRKAPVELTSVLRGAIETSQPLIDQARHTLAISFPEEALMLSADPVRLTQVFSNLLTNAAKYTEKGGRIWLTAKREGSDAVVSVHDDGVGISPELLPRVFNMFTQERHSSGCGDGGLGIGLTLVFSLVKMHGGSVEAKSEGRGRGSEFIVRLPLTQTSQPGSDSRIEQASKGPPRQRVLVVDDNRDCAETLAMLLQSLGAGVRVVYDGVAALGAIEQYRPDLVFLDIGMPGMDGYEVARRIREKPDFRNTKLIALTGWGQDHDRRRSHASGFDRHLTKPVDFSALQALLMPSLR